MYFTLAQQRVHCPSEINRTHSVHERDYFHESESELVCEKLIKCIITTYKRN